MAPHDHGHGGHSDCDHAHSHGHSHDGASHGSHLHGSHPHDHGGYSHSHGEYSREISTADGLPVPESQQIEATDLWEGEADRTLWIDASQGASGDMLLGALLDAGADAGSVAKVLELIAPGLLHLQSRHVVRGPFRAVKVDVIADEPNPPARHLSDVEELLELPGVPPATRDLAKEAFRLLAEAEAHVHGASIESVHFHEVGALDSIGDIVGVCEAIRTLGVETVVTTTVAVGAGTVKTQHGVLTVPPPAVAELAKGWPVEAGGPEDVGELCTPTGMTLIRTLSARHGNMPEMVVEEIGVGAGTRIRKDRAGVVRVVVGTAAHDRTPAHSVAGAAIDLDSSHNQVTEPSFEPDDRVHTVEANVDDMDPRLWPSVLDALISAGANDAWLTPIVMKKGRPAHVVSALSHENNLSAVVDAMVAHTSTIGVRVSAPSHRRVLNRSIVPIDVDGMMVRVKVSGSEDEITHVSIEFDDVARVARSLDIPQREALSMCESVAWSAGLVRGRSMP